MRKPFDIIAAAEQVDGLAGAGFLLQQDLSVARDAGGEVRRQGKRLVEAVGVQALRLPARRRDSLKAGADDVVVHVLRRQAPAGGLRMRPQAERFVRFRREVFLHQLGPDQARGAHLGNFHEGIHADRPEEGEARRKGIHIQPGGHARADILDAVRQRVGKLKVRRRARFLHVIAGNRDRVELRHLLARIGEDVRNDPHAGFRRIDIGVAHHELFQNVILNRPGELFRWHALFLGGDDV